jgi:hypothetical protein
MPTYWSVWDEHLLVVLLAYLWYPTIRTGGLHVLWERYMRERLFVCILAQ